MFTLYEVTKDKKKQKHETTPSAQPHKLMVKPLGVQARLLRVVVAVKLVKVEVDVVVSQYNRNRPSLSAELFPTPDSSCSSLPSSSFCLKQHLTLELAVFSHLLIGVALICWSLETSIDLLLFFLPQVARVVPAAVVKQSVVVEMVEVVEEDET